MLKEIEMIFDEMWEEEIKINLMKTVGSIIVKAKKEVFDDIENKCNLWDTDDVRGSLDTKSGDKWLSMNIVKKLKKRHLSKWQRKNEMSNMQK